MCQLTRSVALLSSGAALLIAAYAGAPAIPSLPSVCLLTAVATALLSRISRRAALSMTLPAVYLSPVMFLLMKGHDHYAYNTVWMSALLGVMSSTDAAGPWNIPARWRWPIATWATVVAVSWPLVAWRALDFTWPLVWDHRLAVVPGLSGPSVVAWTAYAALVHLVGLLWVDFLYRAFGGADRGFRREVVTPLAFAVVIACAVSLYQAFADAGFVSGHVWPSLRRASGTLVDANVFGNLAALWTAVFLVLVLEGRLGVATIGASGFCLTWLGTWASGSRIALLSALVATTVAAIHIVYHLRSTTKRWHLATTALIVAFLGILVLGPAVNRSALDRSRPLVPSASWESVRTTARALWERDGYGQAAVAMMFEHPLGGVGVGAYYYLVHSYALEGTGHTLFPDNAQNWFRHQLAELGFLGSVGWIAWTAVIVFDLWPRRRQTGPGALLRGPLLGLALGSMLGVPGQDPAVVVTFWLLVFWCASDLGAVASTNSLPRASSVTLLLVAGSYLVATATATDLRPPYLAARFGFSYSYGMTFDGEFSARSGQRGVTVQKSQGPWLKLTYWVEHPDADQNRVQVDIWRDGEHIVDRRVSRNVPVTQYVPVTAGKRFVLEVKVDRTFVSDGAERGLAMQWEFVPHARSR